MVINQWISKPSYVKIGEKNEYKYSYKFCIKLCSSVKYHKYMYCALLHSCTRKNNSNKFSLNKINTSDTTNKYVQLEIYGTHKEDLEFCSELQV
jgi:hypothetical protein